MRVLRGLAGALALLCTLPAVAESAADDAALVALMARHAVPVRQSVDDYDTLLRSVGDARIVLLGESTHGSAEFYAERSRITRRLIEEKGFAALALESGWGPAARVNDYIRGQGRDGSAAESLRSYRRYPDWTWRNREFAGFVETLREWNASVPAERRASVHGADIYEAPVAIAALRRHVRHALPGELPALRRAYRCFAPYAPLALDPMLYGRDVARGAMPSCAARVAGMAAAFAERHRAVPDDAAFAAMMAARAVAGAEAYYRAIYAAAPPVSSWNVREDFIAGAVDAILARHGKVVVWAHNSHQGDARETSGLLSPGDASLGQLLRERHGAGAVRIVALMTGGGEVRAASGWGTRDRVKQLRPDDPASWPGLLHRTGLAAFTLDLRHPDLAAALAGRRGDRAVGVNYFPDAEPTAHLHTGSLAGRYDALLYIDRSSALRRLP